MPYSPAPYLYDPPSGGIIQDGLGSSRMKANLVGVGNAHALVPEGGYRAINNVIVRCQRGGASMVGRAISAVMNETPEVFGVKVPSNECKRLERRQVAARDPKFHNCGTASRSSRRNLRALCVRLAKKGGHVKSRAKVRVRSSQARSDRSVHD
jgi:hypothetical protein